MLFKFEFIVNSAVVISKQVKVQLNFINSKISFGYTNCLMDISMNETATNTCFRSPPRRRRSTFFERRDSVVPQGPRESDQSLCIDNQEVDLHTDEQLLRYHDKLLSEKELWKKEVKRRKNKYHDLKQQFQMATKAPSRSLISYSALSNEDIEFIKAKPNIANLVNSQLKLHKSLKETMSLYRRLNELDRIIISDSEDKVQKITNHILENSTIDLTD